MSLTANQPVAEPIETYAEMDLELNETKEAGHFRTILPQILASLAKNMIIIGLGLTGAFPTIVIPVLRGLQKDRNPDEVLFFSDEQASWFGSVAFIGQPFGSAISGWLSEPIGRKKSMILFNIPHIIAWALLAFASSPEIIFVSAILMGLGIGLMEAPIITYIGEICQPSIRGTMIGLSGAAATLGFFIVYLLGSIMTWRNIALICLVWPIATMVVISFVPETPIWLLSKKREDEALASLQWLRGWVSPKAVEKEFKELKIYCETSNSYVACKKGAAKCSHPPPEFREQIKELTRKCIIKPFAIVMFCFAISQFSGMNSIRAYMVQIFKAFEIPVDANWATVVVGVIGFISNIVCMCFVKLLGKRRLYFISLTGAALSCFVLGAYAVIALPEGLSSFDLHDTTQMSNKNNNYLALVMFLALFFFTNIGVTPIPWMLLSEVFPFKSRGIVTGLSAAIGYLMIFVNVKTYINMEPTLKLSGTMFVFGIVYIVGLCGIFFFLPETEGRTLEEIELFFSDNERKMVERHINNAVHDISLNQLHIATVSS